MNIVQRKGNGKILLRNVRLELKSHNEVGRNVYPENATPLSKNSGFWPEPMVPDSTTLNPISLIA